MIHIPFKWNSTAIDDDDLRAIAPVVKAHMTGGTPKQKTYALLLAKMMFRISELKAALPPTGESAEMQDLGLSQLEHCPFCGGTELKHCGHGSPKEPDHYIQCGACTTTGPFGWTEEAAIAAWNRRTPVQSEPVAWMLEFDSDDENAVTVDPKVVEMWRTQHDNPYDVTPLYTHPAKTGVVPGTPPTDERIKEIWESLGYRTRFAPYMLRLARAVLALIDVAPLQVQDERIAQLERLLVRAKNHIVDWWRPDGSLPPAKSPDLVEDIEAALNPAKGAAQ